MASFRPKFSPDKFKELILHAAKKSETDEHFGVVRLSKILFFSDFLCYGLMGYPITGATYIKQPKGPVPTQLNWMVRELEKTRDAQFVTRPIFNYQQKRLVAYRPANLNVFSGEEMDLIDGVISHHSGRTAAEVSELSHERLFAWEIAETGEEIPYNTIFLSGRKPTIADIRRGQELARQYGWLDSAE